MAARGACASRDSRFQDVLGLFELSEKSVVVDLKCFSGLGFIAPADSEDMFDFQESCWPIFTQTLQC